MSTSPTPGALVVSLDFEQRWGWRDHAQEGGGGDPAPDIVNDLCKLFASRGIRATWATVGFLFAKTKDEITACLPDVRPTYQQSSLDPYVEPLGDNETADPQHMAGSLVDQIAATPGQELASHTFSHFYCLEPGQDEEAFRADLAAACAIARLRGTRLTSLVLPRNQWNPAYADAVWDSGFDCYRGPQPSPGHGARPRGRQSPAVRVARLIDTYAGVAPPPTADWGALVEPGGLCNVPASAFLREFDPGRKMLEPLRRARLIAGLRDAARRGRIFHLWWHPHNFSRHPRQSFDLLNRLLDDFDRLAETEGMQSLSMRDVSTMARGAGVAPPNRTAEVG